MGKTIFFNIPASGHINPTLALVTELVQRGETVVYINTEETRSQIEPTGAVFLPYPHMPELSGLISQASGGSIPRNALALTQIGQRLLPFVLETLHAQKPDYVIFDSLCAWGKHGAALLGIPSIASIVTFLIAPGALPPFTPAMILHTLADIIPVMPKYWQVARDVKAQYGVKLGGLMNAVMSTGDMNIIYTSSDFQPSSSRFGATYKFVGPSIGEGRGGDFPFEQITRKPLIYISLGTINNTNLDFYRACFDAFRDHPGHFILSAGKQTDIAALGTLPVNFVVRNFVPQLDVLKQADLFITHGGMNSVHEGLWFNLPLVAIPQQVEQAVVARQVATRGAGIALGMRPPFGQVSAAELRGAVDTILADPAPYKAAAKTLGTSFRAAGGYARAADEIQNFSQTSVVESFST